MSIGSRIKSARTAAGLSMRGLADKAELSHNQIAKYERGQDVPGSAALLRVADALETSPDYFFRESSVSLGAPCWRKKSTLGARKQAQLLARVQDWLERYLELELLMEPWHRDTVAFERPGSLPSVLATGEEAELAAEVLRQEWKLGLDPVGNVAELLEGRGIKVWSLSEAEGFDGCSLVASGGVPVIVINEMYPADRQRLDLLHELGHLLFEVPEGREGEKLLHRFAGAVLFPRVMVTRELSGKRNRLDIGTLHLLKHQYGLSMQAIAARARDLGVITDAYYKEICIRFRRNGWSKREPGDEYTQGARATRFQRLMFTAVAEDVVSRSRAAELLGEPYESFLNSFGLEHGGLEAGACC
ncbi:MAG: helix-turn-helix domain-containing protein [Coriobacteriia bacterium]